MIHAEKECTTRRKFCRRLAGVAVTGTLVGLKAMATPMIGHMDPQFILIMDELKAMLRNLFRTNNELTFPVSATGSAGMETCFVNLLEPGDEALVCVNGVFEPLRSC